MTVVAHTTVSYFIEFINNVIVQSNLISNLLLLIKCSKSSDWSECVRREFFKPEIPQHVLNTPLFKGGILISNFISIYQYSSKASLTANFL